jgi:hypothetical protein
MHYLRYVRELLAEQDDPRAAIVLEELPDHTAHSNPEWTFEAYLRDRLSELERFASPTSSGGSRLLYPVEQWISWRYHGGADRGLEEPGFRTADHKEAVVAACASIQAELDTPEGLGRAVRWYVDRMGARLRDQESRPAAPRPSESLEHAELRRAAYLAEKRELFARLEADPVFPGYELAAQSAWH